MDGHLRPKDDVLKKRFHPLRLDECELVSDDDVNILYPRFGYKQKCHRCGAILKISSGAAYCSECNWDSLTDVIQEKKKCAA